MLIPRFAFRSLHPRPDLLPTLPLSHTPRVSAISAAFASFQSDLTRCSLSWACDTRAGVHQIATLNNRRQRTMASDSHSLDCSCCSHDSSVPSSVHQTLEEMDFDRGIWSAASTGDFSGVQRFLEKGTDPNVPDLSGYTALHYASRRGDYEICEYLLRKGADSNAQTKGGATPLHRAAYCGHLPVLTLLLSHGAVPTTADDDGATPLHKAAERGHREVCEALLQHNPALRTVRDKRSRAPHDLVRDHPALKECLQPGMLT
ncbi:ankyrin repeat domain-containing protein 39 isoform X1 [Mustelus asterias]